MRILTTTQRDAEWHAARLGHATASRMADALNMLKAGGESAARKDYRMQLVCERLTGAAEPSSATEAMQRGTDLEPVARAAYEALTGDIVTECGYLAHDTLETGCSPDGYIGALTETLIEIKCPTTKVHVGYLEQGGIPSDYRLQLLHALWITGAARVQFVSFDPRLPAPLSLFVATLAREDCGMNAHEVQVRAFLLTVDEATNRLRVRMAK